MIEPNTIIFLQDKLSMDDAWDVHCNVYNSKTYWGYGDSKYRKQIAKRENIKFGFVLKTLKSC